MFSVKISMSRWTLHRIHKWMGLVAAIWLIVLGSTGFLLDHRDTWRWLWQEGVSENWVNDDVIEKSKTGQTRLYQINSENSQQHVAGGLTGLWWSADAGKNWFKTKFIGVDKPPMISTVLFTSKNKLWIASDDGLWLSNNGGMSALHITLEGNWVSALSINEQTRTLTGVINRTKIFKYVIERNEIDLLDIKPANVESLPKAISLSRFIRDIHYGRGIFEIPLSLLWNDISAIAMVILPLTGLLFYWLPKRWRRNIQKKKKTSHKVKKQSIRWLFRLHGPTFGLITAIPLIYLSLTGILLDHSKELRDWMKSIEVTRSWQTPVYNLKSWKGEIYSVVNYLDNPDKFSVGTRIGLYTTENNGQHWIREKLLGDKAWFIWTLRLQKENIFIGGMGGPNMVKINHQAWVPVKGVGHMPSDITLDAKSNWVWKSRHGLKSGNLKSGFNHKEINFPVTNYIPWFYFFDALHSGVLIHTQWKWVNDFIAVLAIILVLTGLIRWWRKKWI